MHGQFLEHFLELSEEQLDVGFGIPLHRLAHAAGRTDAEKVAYLVSASVQDALETAFDACMASSLPVERAFAATKRHEAPRLCHVATASRQQIIRQHLRSRQAQLHSLSVSLAALRRSMKSRLSSYAM